VSRRAFSLIEILIVMAVIAILAALLLPTLSMVRDQARATVSATRLDEATRALVTISVVQGETPGFVLRRQLQSYRPAVVRGVLTFRRDLHTLEWFPAATLDDTDPPTTMQAWVAAPYRAFEFAHPWGSQPTDQAGDTPTTLTPTGTVVPLETHALGDLTPVLSAELLRIGGILDPGRFGTDAAAWTAYRTLRKRDQPWNDAWGRPLLMGFAQYHPRRYFGADITSGNTITAMPDDMLFRRARVAYGYAQSIYVAGAAVGPVLPDAVTESALEQDGSDWITEGSGLLAQLWGQSVAVAGAVGGVQMWRTDGSVNPVVNAFTAPPWIGVRRSRSNGRYCLLSAPVEIR